MSVFLSRIVFRAARNINSKCFSINSVADVLHTKRPFLCANNDLFSTTRHLILRNITTEAMQPVTTLENSSISLKKKTLHKKTDLRDLQVKEGHYLTLAYATANSYDLKSLKEALLHQKLYEPGTLNGHEMADVVVAKAVYSLGSERREIMFFRDGAVVFWNCTELEASNVLDFVKMFEIESYPREVVEREKEVMSYVYQPHAKNCSLQESCFVLVPDCDNSLERYTFSHAMVQSARLGALEARLEALAASVRGHTALMEREGAVHVDKKEVVRKLGELFSLRHRLNVESDMLDTPDFYWEEERLERLYSNTVAYFTIPRRTRVLNERLSHCVELLELLSSWAADRHHVRLEWMVIALILAEVCFELLHFFERGHREICKHQQGNLMMCVKSTKISHCEKACVQVRL
ncbi:required for meiotic nuclear division protein 1 homolog isoform X2 [Hyposmocoma kahamanoa]|uniref:required for meiotic nuclear division protein 1 homolog isoform X2 n=1 Tax=Hyposmocoma kahamanoa TaxID=1477025 RepID=UPI000E6D66FB|nr:required for meiotic nuclear division protein 1 homolog isoform X2 [Hyposmocoma kahamanoa]